jgi:hypothetical protein
VEAHEGQTLCLFVDDFYVTWGASSDTKNIKSAGGAPMPPLGRTLGRLNVEDFQTIVDKGLLQYSMFVEMASSWRACMVN